MKRVIFLILIVVAGCNKEVQKADLDKVKGDYEWYHSDDGLFESIYSSDVQDQHGIRIKSRTRVNFYTNGEKTKSLKINRMYETQNGEMAIEMQWNDHVERAMIIENTTLTFFDWPYTDYFNRFQKTD